MSNCCYSFSLPPLMYLNFSGRCRFRHTLVTSAVRRRHHRRRLLKYSSDSGLTLTQTPTIFRLSDDTLQITLKPPSNSLQQLEAKLDQFLNYGREAFDDLRTVVTVDGNNGGWGEVLVYKRDRSLGGREVVVGKKETNWSTSHKSTPLIGDNANYYQKRRKRKPLGRTRQEELPQWWPQVVNWGLHETSNKEEYQTMANQLIRAIMDRKMSGEDTSANDIVQLRHICKTYGVRTFISTANARDSLYRVSINFVLDYCERMSNVSTSIQINGEDVREFIAGLADNIGLESAHAARMVSAAVAARTRSRILQAWALEVQNKHSEALVELFKVCVIHRIFPPAENSPEMEMVARGLDKSLSEEQREYILNSFVDVCGKDIDRSLVEALGLEGARDEQGNGHA
ncbi:hypothetical protein Salat_0541900 [Sesamum alatum]|uniref:Uncharacterized protein n=1 Tax=Sesamum alatum TaxID=300844 RepID=A0AAE1YPJ2_9LAMI|nr:hypothetical protein Salat_0541900 [Sesamum alatum]